MRANNCGLGVTFESVRGSETILRVLNCGGARFLFAPSYWSRHNLRTDGMLAELFDSPALHGSAPGGDEFDADHLSRLFALAPATQVVRSVLVGRIPPPAPPEDYVSWPHGRYDTWMDGYLHQ